MKKRIIFFSLVGLAVGERLVFDLGPNVELVTAAMLLAAYYLGRQWGWRLALLTLFFSDVLLGNTNIFLFTWSGFLLPAFLVGSFFGREPKNSGKLVLQATAAGVGANLFFYIWTNFGVWILDSFGMYERSLMGLGRCYLNGLPFLRLQLMSTVCFVPLGFSLAELGRELLMKKTSLSFGKKRQAGKPGEVLGNQTGKIFYQ